MKIYEITIKPISGFATPLKGDTLFGQFCWQIASNKNSFSKSLKELLAIYKVRPFCIFSSAFAKFFSNGKNYYALKRPDLPLSWIFDIKKEEAIKKRKELKEKIWMILEKGKRLTNFKEQQYKNSKEIIECLKKQPSQIIKDIYSENKKNLLFSFIQPRNTINRLAGTTGEGRFAPFTIEQYIYYPDLNLSIFVGIDEEIISINEITDGIEKIGNFGFGKDASVGLGRFKIINPPVELNINEMGSLNPNACYTLSPAVPEKNYYSKMFFTPFVRFGRHGDVLAKSRNPFKNPIIMIDEGAVLKTTNQEIFKKPYIGQAVSNVSKAEPDTVSQGYSLYIPVHLED